MQIELVDSNVKFSDRYQARLLTKFSSVIDKYLKGMSEDLKVATLSIHKNLRGSYVMKFDMEKVPFAKIYARHTSPDLLHGVVTLRDQVKRQIRESLAKLRDSSRVG